MAEAQLSEKTASSFWPFSILLGKTLLIMHWFLVFLPWPKGPTEREFVGGKSF